jgi:glyoxylase I family protein
VESVSAGCLYEGDPGTAGREGLYAPAARPADPDQVESLASVRMRLSNGALFELTASYANPYRAVDEVFKILGDRGMIRSTRERPQMTDRKPGRLSYQAAAGELTEFDTSGWDAMRDAPVADFLNAVIRSRAGEPWAVLSPASESVETLRVIRAAYRSAADGGRAVMPDDPEAGPRVLHHVAVQTGRYREAVRFYTEVLGMRVLQDRPFKRRTVAWLQAGNTLVEVFSNRAGEELTPWHDRAAGPVHLAFEVPNLREFLAWARARGAVLHPSHPEPFVPPVPGAREIAYLLGPDGEEVEVRERD